MKIRILLVFLLPLFAGAQSLDTLAIHYSGFIKAETMSKDLHVLAADEYEGRETGKKGQKMAAAYIADQFKANGIPPYKEQTYYQPFSIDGLVNSPVFKQVAEISSEGKQFVSEKDYYLLQGRIQHALKTETVQFLGYGIEEPAYNDYKGIDVEGKTLMILQGEPFSKDSLSLVTGTKTPSEWSTFYKKKIERAYQKGATTLFIVDPDFEAHKIAIKTKSAFIKLEKGKPEMAVFYLSKSMADVILKRGIDQLKKKIEAKKKPVHKTVKSSILINVRNLGEKINSENVLGFIEGSDLKDELIVITAHYDHLGKEGDVVYNGADDDGSGTSAILNIAKVFAIAKKEGHGPRRSILCIAFAGEEKGLLGSGYYVDHPEYPLKNTVCDLNIDMIGRIDDKHKGNPNYIYLIGSDKLSSELHQINETMNKTYCKLELDYTYNDDKDKNRYYYRSDHYNFAKNGIPVIFYFNGVHEDYHKETDEVEKIDFNKMEKITRLVFFTAWEIANKKERIVVDSNKK
jgi:hypothetical protein